MALTIAVLIVLTGKLRIHAFLALLSVSTMMGFVFGISASDLVKHIVEGFGGTVGYVGLMVFAATIVGELLAKTGAAAVISESILRFLGKSRLPAAVGSSGYLVAPAVTCNEPHISAVLGRMATIAVPIRHSNSVARSQLK